MILVMYVFMYVLYVCIYVCIYVCMCVCMYLCIYVCMYVYMYVCMYICLYVCVCVRKGGGGRKHGFLCVGYSMFPNILRFLSCMCVICVELNELFLGGFDCFSDVPAWRVM